MIGGAEKGSILICQAIGFQGQHNLLTYPATILKVWV